MNSANLESILNPETRIQSWHSAVNILLRSGILLLVSWYSGVLVSWCPGILVSRCPGVQVSWCPGILVSRYWCPGILVSRYSGAQWPSMQGAMKIFDTSTNVRPTNVGHYKGRTVQTSDWYKPRISTNVGPAQRSDRHKRRTGTFISLKKMPLL